MSVNWWFVSSKAVLFLSLLSTPGFLLSAPRFTPTLTQAPGVGEVLVVKIESLAPPLCLLGDDPTSPFETVHINVGPTSDNPSGNNGLPPPPGFTKVECVFALTCGWGWRWGRARQQDKEEKVGSVNGR